MKVEKSSNHQLAKRLNVAALVLLLAGCFLAFTRGYGVESLFGSAAPEWMATGLFSTVLILAGPAITVAHIAHALDERELEFDPRKSITAAGLVLLTLGGGEVLSPVQAEAGQGWQHVADSLLFIVMGEVARATLLRRARHRARVMRVGVETVGTVVKARTFYNEGTPTSATATVAFTDADGNHRKHRLWLKHHVDAGSQVRLRYIPGLPKVGPVLIHDGRDLAIEKWPITPPI